MKVVRTEIPVVHGLLRVEQNRGNRLLLRIGQGTKCPAPQQFSRAIDRRQWGEAIIPPDGVGFAKFGMLGVVHTAIRVELL